MNDSSPAGIRIYINQSALQNNYQILCSLYPKSSHGAVIKANGYSMGAKTLAKILEHAGCKKFYVARPAEAFDLQKVLSASAQIYVFHGHTQEIIEIYHHQNLIPMIHSRESLELCLTYAKKKKCQLTVAIKLNTGMNRLGLDPEELPTLNWKEIASHLKIESVHSHLACGRTPDHPLNKHQLTLFKQLHQTYFPGIPKGLSASCQSVLPNEYALELTRQGLNLFGAYSPEELPNNPFTFALTVQAKILQVRSLKKGASVGYKATFIAPKDMKLATISMGYADGLPLSLKSQSLSFKVGSYDAPLVGDVSMDLATLDVSEIPEDVLKKNSWVDVFNDNMSLYKLAQAAQTSMHDVILGLGPRCERIVI